MSISNPNISTHAISNSSLNSLIENALENETGPKPLRTPKNKRKPQGQLSEEKQKTSKVINTTSSTQSPPSHHTQHTMSQNNGTRPKMLRQEAKNLEGISCVSAHYTREAILRKDAHHPSPAQKEITYNEVHNKISNYILENKHRLTNTLDMKLKDLMINALSDKDEHNTNFFNLGSDQMAKLANSAFEIFTALCDANADLTKDTNGHYEPAKKSLASKLSVHIPTIMNNNKEDMIPFLTMASRNTELNKELNKLIIKGANFDNNWLTIIHDTMPTAKSGTSIHCLENTVKNIQKDTTEHKHELIEIDNQITKISVRLGDLRTSELEGRYQQTENVIRLHNINSIDEGTPNHFRTLNFPNQLNRIHNLINEHLPSGTAYSTQIITPNKNSKHFEALAVVTFLHSNSKYLFEKKFAEYRRKNPNCKLTTSRPNPQKTTSDRDLPETNDIKNKIGMLYNQKVEEALQKNPNIQFHPLAQHEINSIQVHMKTKRKPFSTYYEFLCPTNNTTFMIYTPSTNPFNEYNFDETIPNPLTRKHSVSDPQYSIRYPPKTYTKKP